MGSRSKNRRPRQAKPVNPAQHEVAIMQRMMENLVLEKQRVIEKAQAMQIELQNQSLVIAFLVQEAGGSVSITDQALEALQIEGLQVEREGDTVVITTVLPPPDEEE